MEQAEREEANWYYQLGGNPLGPVTWAEIEEILETSADAEDLLVARGGDEEWRRADEILKEIEEAEEAAAKAAQEEAEEEEAEAEAEVEEEPKEPLAPVHGLGPWIGQAWEIVGGDLRHFVAAGIIVIAIGLFSALICFPALHAGLYIMALRRFRGEEVQGIAVVEGFKYFGQAFVLYLLMGIAALPVALAGISLLVVASLAADAPSALVGQLSVFAFSAAFCLGLTLFGAVAFYAMPLIVDRDMTAVQAIGESWAITKGRLLSHLGMELSLLLLSGAGMLVCWLGQLITMPLLPAAQVAAYEYHFRDR